MNEVRIRVARWDQDQLPLMALRREVFIDEQQVPEEEELDGLDCTAIHFLAVTDGGVAVGCARLLADGQIGRMAVVADRRRRGIGRQLLNQAVATATNGQRSEVFLHAQLHAVAFYAKAGFEPYGETFMDAGIAHIAMRLELPVG